MPARIPDNVREEVIRRRILQQTFEKIASDLGISHGAAVEIEKQWRKELGVTDANAVLDLAKMMKKLGRGPADCAEGLETAIILKQLGAKPEDVKKFVAGLSEGLIAKGIPAKEVADSVAQITELAQGFGVRPEKVPDLLKEALERLDETKSKLLEASNKYEEVKKRLQSTLDAMHTTEENLCMCVEVEDKLKGLGLSMSKIDDVIKVVQNIEGLGYDPAKVAAAFASTDSLVKEKDMLESEIKSTEDSLGKLTESTRKLQAELSALDGLKKALDKFVATGFNQELLEKLLQILNDVAVERGIPVHVMAGHFLVEMEFGYNAVLGFRKTLTDLEDKLARTNGEYVKEQTQFADYKDAVDSLKTLAKKGVQEKDLIYWHKVLQDHPKLLPEMLTNCLRDYGDLKEAVISLENVRKDLESKRDSLRIDIEALQKDKARAAEELEKLRKTASEELQHHKSKREELEKAEQQLLEKMVLDVIQETAKKALVLGLTLRATKSPLLPIISSENGGSLPKLEELAIAAVYVLSLLERHVSPSDPLRGDLAAPIAAIRKRLGGEGAASSSIITPS